MLLSIVSELNGQPDEADVGDSLVPGWGERLYQLEFDCRMCLISKVILTYFAPEILNQTHIL